MSVVTANRGWSRATLLALLMLLPGARAAAQGRPFTLPSVTDAMGSSPRQLELRVPPMRVHLGLAPHDQGYAQELLRPAPLRGRSALVLMREPLPTEEAPTVASMVTCPMPVVRRDSSAVPAMPRLDPPLSDRGGVTIPSCRNPLDAP